MEITFTSFSITGMPKEKYDPPDPRRMYTIMSSEEAASGKKSYWAELEISGNFCDAFTFCYVRDDDLPRALTSTPLNIFGM